MREPLRLKLCDSALPVVEAWQAYFSSVANTEVLCDDVGAVEADALVAPINSFGRFEGGLESEVIALFGEGFEDEIQMLVREKHDGELVVGQADVLVTRHPQFPFVIVAAVMRTPQNIARTVNPYLAFRAALLALCDFNDLHGDPISSLLVPGLGISDGCMPPLRAARQMRAAYDTVMLGKPPNTDISLDAAVDSDDKITVRTAEAQSPGVLP